ncbi:MAG: ESX secretion-associated protein EspG [Kutzneria sp.]|nr:ESX secretion-associated protein EspG [Kutzneria sp.]MBV9847391.1 ESX secretion-associated protein EspG [Kutzneria sp.]
MALTLSALEFDVLWEHLRLDRPPLPLKVPSPGKTHSERRALADTVWDSLAERDLVGAGFGINPGLVDLLCLLDRPRHEVDARLWFDRGGVRAVAAAKGTDGVIAILDAGQLTLRPVPAHGLAPAILDLLPPAPPGPGYSVTVPSEELDAAAAEAGRADELSWTLRDHGVTPQDADELAAMVGDVRARGQFGAAARDRWERRHRPERVVGFFDTPRGRYVQLRRPDPSGRPWSTIAPADQRRLGQHLLDLAEEAAARARAGVS